LWRAAAAGGGCVPRAKRGAGGGEQTTRDDIEGGSRNLLRSTNVKNQRIALLARLHNNSTLKLVSDHATPSRIAIARLGRSASAPSSRHALCSAQLPLPKLPRRPRKGHHRRSSQWHRTRATRPIGSGTVRPNWLAAAAENTRRRLFLRRESPPSPPPLPCVALSGHSAATPPRLCRRAARRDEPSDCVLVPPRNAPSHPTHAMYLPRCAVRGALPSRCPPQPSRAGVSRRTATAALPHRQVEVCDRTRARQPRRSLIRRATPKTKPRNNARAEVCVVAAKQRERPASLVRGFAPRRKVPIAQSDTFQLVRLSELGPNGAPSTAHERYALDLQQLAHRHGVRRPTGPLKSPCAPNRISGGAASQSAFAPIPSPWRCPTEPSKTCCTD